MIRCLCLLAVLASISACSANQLSASADARKHEQLACASVGIDPASPNFGQCVANLNASEDELTNPAYH